MYGAYLTERTQRDSFIEQRRLRRLPHNADAALFDSSAAVRDRLQDCLETLTDESARERAR